MRIKIATLVILVTGVWISSVSGAACLSPDQAEQVAQQIIDAHTAGIISDAEFEARLLAVIPETCFNQEVTDSECLKNCVDEIEIQKDEEQKEFREQKRLADEAAAAPKE